jgi:hypothetical protein
MILSISLSSLKTIITHMPGEKKDNRSSKMGRRDVLKQKDLDPKNVKKNWLTTPLMLGLGAGKLRQNTGRPMIFFDALSSVHDPWDRSKIC